MIKYFKIFFLLLFLIFSNSIFSQEEIPIADKGVIDLRGVDLSENIELKGEWEFYWNELYDYYDFENTVHSPDAYMDVPGSWSGLIVDGKEIPDTGFATYRLVIFVEPTDEKFMLFFGEILTAYKVWSNEKIITEVGTVAKNSTEAKPGLSPKIKGIDFDKEKIQLIVQISNYNHRTNGFFQTPKLGKEENILREKILNFIFDIIIFGAVLIMALYHLGLFFLRTKNKAALAFALLSLIVGLRILLTNNYTLNYIFPYIPWEFSYRITYFTFYGLVASFIFFFQSTFKEKKRKIFFYSSYTATALFSLTLFLPTIIFTKILFIYQILVFITVIFSIYLLIIYIKQKKTGAISLSFTMLIFFICGLNDILYFNEIIRTTTLTHLGLFVLILGQSYTLSRIFTKSFIKNEELTTKLNYQNKNLEKIVKRRTKEISKKNNDILQKNEELQVQKEELQVQKEEINQQKEFLEQHNKFFTDSVNYAFTIQQAILPSNELIKKYFNSFGDCTGHGVPGAFISLIATYILNSIIVEKQTTDPKSILNLMNDLFKEFLQSGKTTNRDGLELGIMRFEKKNLNNFTYAAAKTNILIYDSEDTSLVRYRGSRKSIGYASIQAFANRINFENKNYILKDTQTIYCYTDGFVDQNNFDRKRFGTKQFKNMINENGNLPLQQQKIIYTKTLKKHQKNESQRDDITLVGLKPKN